MNRFPASILTGAAEQGRSILVVSKNQHDARTAFRVLEGLATTALRITRAAGREQITYPNGGEITVCTLATVRGRTADVVHLNWDGAAQDHHAIQVCTPVTATSTRALMTFGDQPSKNPATPI